MSGNLFVNRPYVSVTWDDPERRIATVKIYEKGLLIRQTSSLELGISPRDDDESITDFRNKCKEEVFTKWMAQEGKGGEVTDFFTKADLEQKIRAQIADLQKQIEVLESFAATLDLAL